MAYCDICGNYDDEHTDGEPSMMRGRNYKPLLDYYYSATIMNKWQPDYVKYDCSHFLPNTDCMCEHGYCILYHFASSIVFQRSADNE